MCGHVHTCVENLPDGEKSEYCDFLKRKEYFTLVERLSLSQTTYLMKYSEALSAFKQISYSVSQGKVINLGVEHSLVFHFYS